MPRLGCVELPVLPLQILLQRHPDWRGHPAVVVDRDHPQGVVQWANRRALRHRILPGTRYAHALSITTQLRAGVIEPAEIDQAIDHFLRALHHFTPDVEPARDFPGVFWVDPEGLAGLFPSDEDWAQEIADAFQREGYRAHVAVGFTRFGTFATTKIRRGPTVFRSPQQERQFIARLSLERLGLEPKLLASLTKLGVYTVGAFLELPVRGLRTRFGAQAQQLAEWALDRNPEALTPVRPEAPLTDRTDLDMPIENATTLLFLIKRRLPPLLGQLADRGTALEELEIHLDFEKPLRPPDKNTPPPPTSTTQTIRPAKPTLDLALLLHLVALRFEGVQFSAGVEGMTINIQRASTATSEQLLLFRDNPRRDLRAAQRALARLRARFGDDAVRVAVLQERHLPEARYSLEPFGEIEFPQVSRAREALVRRIYANPLALPPQPRNQRDDGWLIRGLGQGAAVDENGPYIVSGGWWSREIHREYHFIKTMHGDVLWTYYDKVRRRWYLQGEVQ